MVALEHKVLMYNFADLRLEHSTETSVSMFREDGEKISGVLNDYDMAVDSTKKESGQRTGTKPFFGSDLHDDSPPTHSYRHDLESLIYCLLWVITKRQVTHQGKRESYRPTLSSVVWV